MNGACLAWPQRRPGGLTGHAEHAGAGALGDRRHHSCTRQHTCSAYRFASGSDEDIGDPLVTVVTVDFLEFQPMEENLSQVSGDSSSSWPRGCHKAPLPHAHPNTVQWGFPGEKAKGGESSETLQDALLLTQPVSDTSRGADRRWAG